MAMVYDANGNATGYDDGTDTYAGDLTGGNDALIAANSPSAPGAGNVTAVAFNQAAALGVYAQLGTVEWGVTNWRAADYTIKANTVETNLAALDAGYAGTELAATVDSFTDTILAYPELRDGMEALLKDEGMNAVDGIQAMLTGEGSIDMAEFQTMMENPEHRAIIANMFEKVGTSEYGMDSAVEFTRRAQAALRDPNNTETRNAFMQYADSMGVSTSGLQTQFAMGQIGDFFRDPDKFISELVSSMNLPPEWANMITGLMSGITQFAMDTGQYYWNGQDGQPGLQSILSSAGNRLDEFGGEINQRYAAAPSGSVPGAGL